MATIGTLSRTERGAFVGKIETLAFTNVVGLRGVNSNNPRAPKFELMARTAAGTWVPIAGMFEQTSKASGESFYTGRIDDPSFARPMDVAMFQNDEGGYNINWTRRRTRQELPAETDAAPDSGLDAGMAIGPEDVAGDGLGQSTATDEAHLEALTNPKSRKPKGDAPVPA